MDKKEFYKYYLPALNKALASDERKNEDFFVKGPEFYIQVSEDKLKEIDIYLGQTAGKDKFLDNVAYYFDAKSHGFDEINGVNIKKYKENLRNEILVFKEKYNKK